MREKFEKIPPPLQKQIIMRCGAALVSLLLMVVSLLLEGNLYLSLSVLLFFAFYGFSGAKAEKQRQTTVKCFAGIVI